MLKSDSINNIAIIDADHMEPLYLECRDDVVYSTECDIVNVHIFNRVVFEQFKWDISSGRNVCSCYWHYKKNSRYNI